MSNPIPTAKQLLTTLVNAANADGKQWTADELVFGIPQVAMGEHNTKISVTATDTETYTGSRELSYQRVALSAASKGQQATIVLAEAITTTVELAALLRAKYKVNLDPEDVISEPLSFGEPGSISEHVVTSALTSLKWYGAITVQVTQALIDLADAIPNNLLDGLTLDMLAIE